jgi:hypothetical protein
VFDILRAIGLALAAALAAISPSGAAAQDRPAATSTPDARSVEIAREIIAIGMPEEDREIVFAATMDQMLGQMREAQRQSGVMSEDPQIEAIIDANLAQFRGEAMGVLRTHLPAMMEGWALAYANTFSHEDLLAIREFVRTPTGQRFFQLSPAIAAEPNFAAANQLYMNDVMAMLPALQARLTKDIVDYLEAKQAEGDAEAS